MIYQRPQQLEDNSISSVDQLAARLNTEWMHLQVSRDLAVKIRKELTTAVQDLTSTDMSIVLAGSLGRDEFTGGSDIDWFLLIDGSADSDHHTVFQRIQKEVNARAAQSVSPDRIFDIYVFSHGLVHNIGGVNDSFHNIIHRMVLFLDSKVVGSIDAYNRVKRIILKRYLLEDRNFWLTTNFHVPGLLLNDIARFWREIGAGVAYKRRKYFGKGYGIHDIKLQLSRKVLYVSGLLACFHFHLNFSDDERKALFANPNKEELVVEHLESVFQKTPLEVIADVLLRYPHLDQVARKIMDSYSEFIGTLADQEKRTHLENLTPDKLTADAIYQRLYEVSVQLQDGLMNLLFDSKSGLDVLTKHYVVFGSDI